MDWTTWSTPVLITGQRRLVVCAGLRRRIPRHIGLCGIEFIATIVGAGGARGLGRVLSLARFGGRAAAHASGTCRLMKTAGYEAGQSICVAGPVLDAGAGRGAGDRADRMCQRARRVRRCRAELHRWHGRRVDPMSWPA
jgi:hypothetical protein